LISGKQNILITNDDGIDAPGIRALYKALLKCDYRIFVVAPASEMSAVGHAITLSDPLRVKEVNLDKKIKAYRVNGTPADCVKIAYWALLDIKPDLIISGINTGSNTGINMLYSGTVSAATEGSILGIPSFAISLATYSDPDFSFAADFSCRIAEIILKNRMPESVFLNINVPNLPKEKIKGVKVTRQGRAIFVEKYEKRYDPRGNTYYWLSGQKIDKENETDIDEGAVQNGYVSVTPVHFDLTHHNSIDMLEKWNIKI